MHSGAQRPIIREVDEMLIRVHVITNSKRAAVERTGSESYKVIIDEKAVEGRANIRLIEIMAEHLGVRKSQISIVKGTKAKDKLLQLHQ